MSEVTEILNGLAASVSGLRERRYSAGRKLLVMSLEADVAEMTEILTVDVLERVSHDIVLEACDVDYGALAEGLLSIVPVSMSKADADEVAACLQLDEALNKLGGVLT